MKIYHVMNKNKFLLYFIAFTAFSVNASFSQNPIIRDQFSADPSARVFEGKVYLYPSHDIPARPGRGRAGWFVMEDYHVFSSSNLTDWTDHGVIVSQDKVSWVDSTSFSMWAPDCIFKNGKYYFFFPSNARPPAGKGFSVGVAVSDKPYGPFVPQPEPIKNLKGIDPCPFINKDGQAYIYWAMGNIYVAKLKDNMLELASDPLVIANLPEKGLKEGPFLFERNGIYYLTYPHVENKTERLEYAIADNPMGPFKVTGVIMDESPTGCWTNHQSFIGYKGQWYLFYHHNDYSPGFDKNRSVRADSMFFNSDGTIRKVKATLRGIGLTDASSEIQIDRYSAISDKGASIAFLDSANTFMGWKTILSSPNAWIRYNSVDFGKKGYKTVTMRASSEKGSTVQIHLDAIDGPLVSEIKIPAQTGWKTIDAAVKKPVSGIHHLAVVQIGENKIEFDWISFR